MYIWGMRIYFYNGEYFYSFSDKHGDINDLLNTTFCKLRRSPVEICRIECMGEKKTIYYYLN